MRSLRLFVLLIPVVIILSLGSGCTQSSDEKEFEPGLTFCQISPRIRMIKKNVRGNPKNCDANAVIQGVQWSCTKGHEIESKVLGYLQTLMQKGDAACDEYCKEVDPKCVGVFDRRQQCGLTLKTQDAQREGPVMGCRTSCPGRALAYCSIYNLGFQSRTAELIENAQANCRCYRESSSSK